MTVTSAAVPRPEAVAPATTKRTYSTAWWGMVVLIMTEAMIFLGLLGAYFFLRAASKQWPPPGVELPELKLSAIFSVVLWGSSIPIIWAERGLSRGKVSRLAPATFLSFLMGVAFLGYTAKDFIDLHFGWRDHAYGSIFYTTVGLHALHVLVGLLMSIVVQLKIHLGKITRDRHQTFQIFSLYWHFVDTVWLFVFPSLFISAHIR